MSNPPEVAELHRLIASLGQHVTSMKSRYGETPAMRRLVNDVERLEIDAAELDLARGAQQHHPGEKIPVPDTQYDSDFWRDVDDEGLGGQR